MVDEALLIRRSQQGDRNAFEEIVRRMRNRVFWTAYRIVGEEEAAKDVSQAVFVRLWKNLGRVRAESPLDPWLRRVTVNLSIDAYRKARSERRVVQNLEELDSLAGPAPVPGADSPETAVSQREVQRIFDRLAGRLSRMQRAVFVLTAITGYSAEETGSMLRIRPSTVRNHLLNARRQLRRSLRKLYPEYWRTRVRRNREDT